MNKSMKRLRKPEFEIPSQERNVGENLAMKDERFTRRNLNSLSILKFR